MSKKKINIDVDVDKKSITELRAELKQLKSDIASATDPDDMLELAKAAGEVQDKISDINEQVSIFASGSQYQQVSNSIGAVGKSLLQLDFGKAQDRANAFSQAARQITFKNAITSVKQLGSTFLTIGKSLLTNPLFLLGTIIAMIVKAVYEWLDSIGFIQKALDVLMWPLNKLIEGLKALGDWFGWTSNAQDKMAKEAIASNVKIQEQQIETTNIIVRQLDREIDRRRALGESIKELEEERAKVLAESSRQQAREQGALVNKLLDLGKDLNDEEVVEARKKHKELISIAEDAEHNLEMVKLKGQQKRAAEELKIEDMLNEQKIKNVEDDIERERLLAREKLKQRVRDFQSSARYAEMDAKTRKKWMEWFRNERDKIEEETENKIKVRNNKRAADSKKEAERTAKFIENLNRKQKDLEIKAIEDETERALAENKTKYERIIADTLANEKLLQSEKDKLIALFQKEQEEREMAIKKEANDKRQKEELDAQKEYNELILSLNENSFIQEKAAIENQSQQRLDLLKKQLESGLITKEQFDNAEIALEQEKQKRLDELKGMVDGGMTAIEKAQMEADALRNVEKQRLEAGIIDYEEYAARIAQIDENLANKLKQEDEKVRQQRVETFNVGINAAQGAFGAITSLSEASTKAQIANAEGNEAKQEQLRKKGFEQSKKFQIAQATIAGIQGVINALTAQSTIPEPFGSILKGVNAGIVAATTAANITKIKATKYEGGGGASPSTTAGSPSVPSRALPNVSFQGAGGTQNNVSAGGTQPMEITLNNNVAVSATEVEEVQQTNAMLANNAQI